MRTVTEVCVRLWAWANLLTLAVVMPVCVVAFPLHKAGATPQAALIIAVAVVGGFHLWRKV